MTAFIRILVLAVTLTAMLTYPALAADPSELTAAKVAPLLDKCSDLINRINKGISLDRFSESTVEIESEMTRIISDEEIKNFVSYDSLSNHLEEIKNIFGHIGDVWVSQERDGYKFINVWVAREGYKVDCGSFKLGNNDVCRLSDVKNSLQLEASKQISIIKKGFLDGF